VYEAFNPAPTVYGQPTQDIQTLNFLLGLYDHAQKHRKPMEDRWRRNYEFYYGVDQMVKKAPHQSKLFIPRPYLVVNTKTPKMVKSLLAKDPIFRVLPVSKDDEIKARVSSELLTYQLRNQENGFKEMVLWFKDSHIYGGSIAKSGWEYSAELATRREMGPAMVDPFTMAMTQQEMVTQEWITTADRPIFKNVDIGEIYPDPYADSIESCNFIIHRMMCPLVKLKKYQQYGLYKNVDLIQESNINEWSYEFSQRRFSTKGIDTPDTTPFREYNLVEVLECWWTREDGQRQKTTIANKNTIIQDIPFPYWHYRWPFYLLQNDPMTKEFWSQGEIDPIVDLVRELNDLRNQQNDNRNQFLKAFWVVSKNANVDLDELESMPPGGILEVTGDPNMALNIIRPPQLDAVTANYEQKIDGDIQVTTGANDISFGSPVRGQVRTATTGSLMQEATDTRYGLTSLLYLEQLRKLGKDWLALNQQYMRAPVAIKILGEDGIMMDWQATPYDIPRQFDLYVAHSGEWVADKDVRRQQMLQLFSIGANIPGFVAGEYFKKILYEFDEKNPEFYMEGRYVVPTPLIMQQMGIQPNDTLSSYKEQIGGLLGGGTQGSPQLIESKADVLQEVPYGR